MDMAYSFFFNKFGEFLHIKNSVLTFQTFKGSDFHYFNNYEKQLISIMLPSAYQVLHAF